eukprot:403332534
MKQEVSRDEKKMQQLIALIEKQEMQQKKKLEKKKIQQEQGTNFGGNNSSGAQQIMKKSQSVALPQHNSKPKPKINLSFAPGALDQNAKYMYQQQQKVENSYKNWYSWNHSKNANDVKNGGYPAFPRFQVHRGTYPSKNLNGTSNSQDAIKTTLQDRNHSASELLITSSNGVRATQSQEREQEKLRLKSDLNSIAVTNELKNTRKLSQQEEINTDNKRQQLKGENSYKRQRVDSNGRESKVQQNTESQLSSNYESPQKMSIMPDEPVNIESRKEDRKEQFISVSSESSNLEDQIHQIFLATQKIQNEMKEANSLYGRPVYQDQLYMNLKEGRSLKAALLMRARTAQLHHSVPQTSQ